MAMSVENLPFNGDTFMEAEFLKIKEKYAVRYVIETGTYKGFTTRWLARNFDYVFSVEIMEHYYKEALNYLIGIKNVEIYHSNSTKILPLLLLKSEREISRNTDKGTLIVFLDSHWYANPVLKELEIIAASGMKPILCIHDMKNPNDETMAYDRYPEQNIVYEYSWVKPGLDLIYGYNGYDHYFNTEATGARCGALWCTPK